MNCLIEQGDVINNLLQIGYQIVGEFILDRQGAYWAYNYYNQPQSQSLHLPQGMWEAASV